MTPSLAPLPFAVPLLTAAVLMGTGRWISRRWADSISLAVAGIVTAICIVLLVETRHGMIVYWFGDWGPSHGIPLGIAFSVDLVGAGLATLAAGLVTAALVFSWHYFEEIGNLYNALILIFLAAMCGFCLTGDLFNLFVCFELMSTAAFALTAYKIEDKKALLGGLNFAVTNTIGAFLVLMGITLLYARTGVLNFAMIARALAGHPADGLVVVSFLLITAGFFIKGAIIPFHFWLADAHAVGPTPVCVLFSGVMVCIELIDVARVFWTMYAPAMLPNAGAIHAIFIGFGIITILVGGIMCFLQRHIKRLLAFSTISHMGIVLCGMGLLDSRAFAGVLIYALAHGVIKAALYFSAGILLARFGTVDEIDLRGRGRDMRWTGLLFLIGGLGLAGAAPFPTALGSSIMDVAARNHGYAWLPLVFMIGTALSGSAVLRVTGRVYLNWGPDAGENKGATPGREPKETSDTADMPPRPLLLPPIVLLALALAGGLLPQLAHWAGAAAPQFVDTTSYAAAVLNRQNTPVSHLAGLNLDLNGVMWSAISTIIALGIAWLALRTDRLPQALCKPFTSATQSTVNVLRLVHSGDVRDYVTWIAFGLAALGALLAIFVN